MGGAAPRAAAGRASRRVRRATARGRAGHAADGRDRGAARGSPAGDLRRHAAPVRPVVAGTAPAILPACPAPPGDSPCRPNALVFPWEAARAATFHDLRRASVCPRRSPPPETPGRRNMWRRSRMPPLQCKNLTTPRLKRQIDGHFRPAHARGFRGERNFRAEATETRQAARDRASAVSVAATTRSTSMASIARVSVLRFAHGGRASAGGSMHAWPPP